MRAAPTPTGARPSGPSAWAVPVVPKQSEASKTWSRDMTRSFHNHYDCATISPAPAQTAYVRFGSAAPIRGGTVTPLRREGSGEHRVQGSGRERAGEQRLDPGLAADDVARAGAARRERFEHRGGDGIDGRALLPLLGRHRPHRRDERAVARVRLRGRRGPQRVG